MDEGRNGKSENRSVIGAYSSAFRILQSSNYELSPSSLES